MRFRGPGVTTLLLPSFPGLHLAPASTPPADAEGIWHDLQAPGVCLGSKCTLSILPGDDAAGILQTNFFCIPWLPANLSRDRKDEGRKGDRVLLPPVRGCLVSVTPAATFHPTAALSCRNSWFISSFFPHPPTQLTVSATGTSMSRTHIPPPESAPSLTQPLLHAPETLLLLQGWSPLTEPFLQIPQVWFLTVLASASPQAQMGSTVSSRPCSPSAPCCQILSIRCSQVK